MRKLFRTVLFTALLSTVFMFLQPLIIEFLNPILDEPLLGYALYATWGVIALVGNEIVLLLISGKVRQRILLRLLVIAVGVLGYVAVVAWGSTPLPQLLDANIDVSMIWPLIVAALVWFVGHALITWPIALQVSSAEAVEPQVADPEITKLPKMQAVQSQRQKIFQAFLNNEITKEEHDEQIARLERAESLGH